MATKKKMSTRTRPPASRKVTAKQAVDSGAVAVPQISLEAAALPKKAPRPRRVRKTTASAQSLLKDDAALKKPSLPYQEIKAPPAPRSMMAAAAEVFLKGRKLWDRLLGER